MTTPKVPDEVRVAFEAVIRRMLKHTGPIEAGELQKLLKIRLSKELESVLKRKALAVFVLEDDRVMPVEKIRELFMVKISDEERALISGEYFQSGFRRALAHLVNTGAFRFGIKWELIEIPLW